MSDRIHDRVGRRETLRALGAGTIGLTGFLPGYAGARSGPGKTKIVTHKSGDEVKETRSVGEKWYSQVKRTREVQRALNKQYGSNEAVISVGRTALDETVGDLRKPAVQVTFDEKTEDTPTIPDTVNSVPVVTREGKKPRETCYTGYKDNLKGGHGLQYKEDGNSYNGTLACRAFKGGTKYMMSCRHLFITGDVDNTNCLDEDVIGRKWYQGGEAVGRVEYAYQNADMVLLNMSLTDDRTFTDQIVREDGGVSGRTTEDGNDYLMSDNVEIHKRGRTTCWEWGEITNLGGISSCWNGNYVDDTVSTNIDTQAGDSGGPVYHRTGSSQYIVSINTHELGKNESHGASANSMNRDWNVTFGDTPYF